MTEKVEVEVAKRRDAALRRALNTPPKPHKKATGDGSKASQEPHHKPKRET